MTFVESSYPILSAPFNHTDFKKPVGFSGNTITTAMYGKTMANCGTNNTQKDCVMPNISDPTMAPHMFPNPPMVTIRKASIMML